MASTNTSAEWASIRFTDLPSPLVSNSLRSGSASIVQNDLWYTLGNWRLPQSHPVGELGLFCWWPNEGNFLLACSEMMLSPISPCLLRYEIVGVTIYARFPPYALLLVSIVSRILIIFYLPYYSSLSTSNQTFLIISQPSWSTASLSFRFSFNVLRRQSRLLLKYAIHTRIGLFQSVHFGRFVNQQLLHHRRHIQRPGRQYSRRTLGRRYSSLWRHRSYR